MVSSVQAQDGGNVAGVVVSTWDASPLAGVVVSVRGTTLAAQTDLNGRYELKGLAPGDQVLRFSKSGFASAVVTDVRVLLGQTTTVNGNLRPEYFEMEEYEVTAEEFTDQTEQILLEKEQSGAMLDAIGSEQFSRLGASDAADIVSHVTGVTIVEGKFAVIRGLNDRYTSTLLNGAEIPSSDPYRKAAQLDMFPAEMIEQVNVSKTFTPDQPGGFAGGSINMITKPFPEKSFINFSAGVAYNSQSTGNDQFLNGPDEGNDYWASAKGFWAVPSGVLTTDQGPPSFTRDPALANQVVSEVQSFKNPLFAPTRQAPDPDSDWAISLGGTTNLFGDVRLGLIGGINHSTKYRYYEGANYNRYISAADGGLEFIRGYDRDRGTTEIQWGGVLGVALELSPQHRVSYTVVNNQFSENVGQFQQGTSAIIGDIALAFSGYTERNLFNQQLKGEHEFPELANLRFDWLASLTDTSQDEPSLRYYPMQLFPSGDEYYIISAGADIPDARAPTIYSRSLNEQNTNYRLDWTLPFSEESATPRDIKFGYNHSSSERDYSDQRLLFDVRETVGPQTGQPETFPNDKLDLANYGYTIDRRGNYIFDSSIQRVPSGYTGTAEIPAGYLMADWSLTEWLRITGGARYEKTDMRVDAATGEKGSIQENDVLPSIACTIKLREDMDVRLSYAETVARPTYREFAPVAIYDFYADEYVVGNANLNRTQIVNYDARWEWFLPAGDLLSAGVFYKKLTDPIEKYVTRQITTISFINRPDATLYGFELEARKNLGFISEDLSGFSVGGNYTYVSGKVKIAEDVDADGTVFVQGHERDSLYEQSDYILNADISYDHKKSGFAVTLSYNISGERLVVAGSNSPDIYEQPAASLDLVISKRIGKHWTIKASGKNLLDPTYEQTYGREGEYPEYGPYASYTKGITFGLSLSGEF